MRPRVLSSLCRLASPSRGSISSSIRSFAGNTRDPSNSGSRADALPDGWKQTYEAKTKPELIKAYANWQSYDTDSMEKFGYRGPPDAAEFLSLHVPPDARVLDAGVGTGLVGEFLSKEYGFTELVGVDLAATMVERAAAKGLYSELFVADLEDMSRQFPEAEFDAAICVGTFTHHHVGTVALDEIIRVVKVGGVIIYSARDDFLSDELNGFARALRTLQLTGALELIDSTPPRLYTPRVSDSVTFRCWAYRVMASGVRGPFVTCS